MVVRYFSKKNLIILSGSNLEVKQNFRIANLYKYINKELIIIICLLFLATFVLLQKVPQKQ